MFEYQTTGTHLIFLFRFEVLLVNAREELWVEEGEAVVMGGTSAYQSFIGGRWRRPCVWCRCRRQKASPCRPNLAARRPLLGNLRCCAFWAWLRRSPAPGRGPPAGGSLAAPTAPPSANTRRTLQNPKNTVIINYSSTAMTEARAPNQPGSTRFQAESLQNTVVWIFGDAAQRYMTGGVTEQCRSVLIPPALPLTFHTHTCDSDYIVYC